MLPRRQLSAPFRRLSSQSKPLFHVPKQDAVSLGTSKKLLVRDLELTIREGERWAIVGPNGSGKSTTASLIGKHFCGREEDRPGAYATIAFESHRQLLRDELREYQESRSDVTKLRATLASFLFPHLAPEDPDFKGGFRATAKDGTAVGYRPQATRLAPLIAAYDATFDDPLLADLERAVTTGEAGRLLEAFGLRDVRHRPVFAMSTGEARKMLIMNGVLAPSQLWVLDETFDGLDQVSRVSLRDELATLLPSAEWAKRALALITHHREEIMGSDDERVLTPTHGLLIGQGDDGTGHVAGEWDAVAPALDAYFAAQQQQQWVRPTSPPKRPVPAVDVSAAESGPPGRAPATARSALVDFRSITVRYNSHVVFDGLSWVVREGEKWVVLGGNGTGKSTIVELITGDNLQGYRQDVHLFGRKKGSGESVWEIKKQLGLLSTEFHMQYIDYADPAVRTAFRKPEKVSTWEVVCSGFFDTMGLYDAVTIEQERYARDWIDKLGLYDLVTPPPQRKSSSQPSSLPLGVPSAKYDGQNFFHLSHGQQKLVLLCRAMVKKPRLLLLDEPTHGLSGVNKERLLYTLSLLADDPNVGIVYVTHRQDEIDALGFEHVLQLGASSSRR